MFASVRFYRLDSGSMDEAMHRADERLADRLADEPGFVAYHVVGCEDGSVCSLTIFRDREGAQRSDDIAAEFVRDHLSDMEITRLDSKDGELMVSRAANEVLEPAHH